MNARGSRVGSIFCPGRKAHVQKNHCDVIHLRQTCANLLTITQPITHYQPMKSWNASRNRSQAATLPPSSLIHRSQASFASEKKRVSMTRVTAGSQLSFDKTKEVSKIQPSAELQCSGFFYLWIASPLKVSNCPITLCILDCYAGLKFVALDQPLVRLGNAHVLKKILKQTSPSFYGVNLLISTIP
jgi:hypothetical protein